MSVNYRYVPGPFTSYNPAQSELNREILGGNLKVVSDVGSHGHSLALFDGNCPADLGSNSGLPCRNLNLVSVVGGYVHSPGHFDGNCSAELENNIGLPCRSLNLVSDVCSRGL